MTVVVVMEFYSSFTENAKEKKHGNKKELITVYLGQESITNLLANILSSNSAFESYLQDITKRIADVDEKMKRYSKMNEQKRAAIASIDTNAKYGVRLSRYTVFLKTEKSKEKERSIRNALFNKRALKTE